MHSMDKKHNLQLQPPEKSLPDNKRDAPSIAEI